jgi:hypothetical protein
MKGLRSAVVNFTIEATVTPEAKYASKFREVKLENKLTFLHTNVCILLNTSNYRCNETAVHNLGSTDRFPRVSELEWRGGGLQLNFH